MCTSDLSSIFNLRYKSTWHSNSDCNCCAPFIQFVGRAVLVAVKSWHLDLQVVWQSWFACESHTVSARSEVRKKQSVMTASSSGIQVPQDPSGNEVPCKPETCSMQAQTLHYTSPCEVESKEQAVAEVVVSVCVCVCVCFKSTIIIANNHPGVLFMLQVISLLPGEEC